MTLDAAERAMAQGQFERARQIAQEVLESGRLDPDQVPVVVRVLAISRARTNDSEGSQRAFVELLALQPNFRLDRSELPEVRSPYMEARGFWSMHPTPLEVGLERASDTVVRLKHVDPAHLAARVKLRIRLAGEPDFSDVVVAPTSGLTIPVSQPELALDYSLAVLDEFGNRILKLGDDRDALQLPGQSSAPTVKSAPTISSGVPKPTATQAPWPASLETEGRRKRRRRFIGLGATALVLGAGGLAMAAGAHLERQDLARRWNGYDCDGYGVTRREICADEGDRVSQMEHLMIAGYAVGAAGLASGLVLLLLAPRHSQTAAAGERHALRCGNMGWAGITCGHSF